MDCRDWKKELETWLDRTEIPRFEHHGVPRRLMDHPRECPHCAALLGGALKLVQGKFLQLAAPHGLDAAVMNRIHLEGRRSARYPQQRRSTRRLRWVVLPVAASLVVALNLFLFFRILKPPAPDTVLAHLILEAPSASRVTVVGDWNGWDPSRDRLTDPDGDGVWEKKIRIRRGREYRYQFIIDDELWIPDPESPLQVDDGFGGINSVLQI